MGQEFETDQRYPGGVGEVPVVVDVPVADLRLAGYRKTVAGRDEEVQDSGPDMEDDSDLGEGEGEGACSVHGRGIMGTYP